MLEATGSLLVDAEPLLSGAAGVACQEPGALMNVLSRLAFATVSYFNPGDPAMLLLAPKVVDAALRMLLVSFAGVCCMVTLLIHLQKC